MSLKTLENEILRELRAVTGNPKLKMKDVMEWRTTEIAPQAGETVVHLAKVGVYVAYKGAPSSPEGTE